MKKLTINMSSYSLNQVLQMLSHLCLILLAKLKSGLWLLFIPSAKQTSTAGRDYFPFWRVLSARRTPASELWHCMTCKNQSQPIMNFRSQSELQGRCMKQCVPHNLKQTTSQISMQDKWKATMLLCYMAFLKPSGY